MKNNSIDINSALIGSLAFFLKSAMVLSFDSLAKCSKCLLIPATVKNKFIDDLICCDKCAAEMIVTSGRSYLALANEESEFVFNEIRKSLMNEDFWIEIKYAVEIRNVLTYLEQSNPEIFMQVH
jgi:hypothetical protein